MRATDFVTSYIDAWNHQDSHAVADHLADNGTYLDIPVQQHMSREEMIAHLDELFKTETNFYELSGDVLANENTIAFQYRVQPRTPNGEADESEIWFGAEFISLRAGAAVEIADYYEQRDTQSPMSPLSNVTKAGSVRRYAKSGLSKQQLEEVKQQLISLMEVEKIYLQPDLTLPDLARELDCTVNHLSQAINAGFGMSFFDYLNEYRVKNAMRLLCPTDGKPPTILTVALEVGFNSTSTFYAAFKKVSGETPAQYRRAQAQDDSTE